MLNRGGVLRYSERQFIAWIVRPVGAHYVLAAANN